ncbi:MAG: sensor histidine kinase [Bacteroidetes bacterium]|nr:sensor histidine kinase [Bacteroidota bacterium]MBS1931623.1 sensor histidine kinase [Bacteroidota bacterium]
MFPTKNISPRTFSFFTSLILAIVTGLLLFIYNDNWKEAIGVFAVVFIIGFFLFSFVMERFTYRKIKLIYKFIYQTKATKKEETYYKYLLPKRSIEEVSADVEAWAEEHKQEIESLRQNEQFRKEFLQNLSHEFKTPVFAIQGYVDTLLHGALENPEVNKPFLEKAAKNIERLTNLINDLDEISGLERGEINLYKENFIIQDLVREVFESLSIRTEPRHIKCSIKKGCESPLTVFADKEKIRQVLRNLVENSVKYGKDNGNIVASMYQTDGKHILVELSDDGIGISEKNLARVFERFYRTEEGRRIDVTGSGLGLAICKHIIEAHDQSIHVRSTEGIGTTIGFTLEARKD